MSNKLQPILFILVHGTFAANAEWSSENGGYANKLRNTFGDGTVIKSFNWSGINSHKERFSASVEFRKLLLKTKEQYKSHRKIIIAHSHGGNLSIYALADDDLNKHFELITLGTPFLRMTVRNYSLNYAFHKYLLCGNLFLYLLMIPTAIILMAIDYIFGSRWLLYGMLLSFPTCFYGMYKLLPRFYNLLVEYEKKLPEFIHDCKQKYEVEKLKSYKILAVIDNRDEIKIWFGILGFIWTKVMSVYDFVFKTIFTIFFIGVFGGLIWIIIGAFIDGFTDGLFDGQVKMDLQSSKITQFMLVIFVTVIQVALIFPFITFLIPLLFVFIKSNPLALGWENIKFQLFINFTSHVKPINSDNFTFITANKINRRLTSLRHSIYEDNFVFEEVCKWISKTESSDLHLSLR